jgi:hypothetical protein
MELKFTVEADALRAALDVIQIVAPAAITTDGGRAFLFLVGKKANGEDACWVYSRDGVRAARAELPIRAVEGEGPFAYPAEHISAFAFARGEVAFRATSNGAAHTVEYTFGDGAGSARPTYDPRLLSTIDKKLSDAAEVWSCNAQLLQWALAASKPFLSRQVTSDNDQYNVVRVVGDASTLYAVNGYGMRLYFNSEAFAGHALQIARQDLGAVEKFLSRCGSHVDVRVGKEMTFVMDRTGALLGWANVSSKPVDPKRMPLSWDSVVLMVPVKRTLEQLKYLRTELEEGYPAIRVDYANQRLRFRITHGARTSSLPIDVVVAADSQDRPYECEVRLEHLLDLFTGLKTDHVELRLIPLDEHGALKGARALRTVDRFSVHAEERDKEDSSESIRCTVERFAGCIVRGGA